MRLGVCTLRLAYVRTGDDSNNLEAKYLPPEPVVIKAPEPKLKPETQEQEYNWDPEPVWEASRCRALLLEVVRRAIHDWVLYRQHTRMELKELANDAYVWLFEEGPGHPNWEERQVSTFEDEDDDSLTGIRGMTAFLTICEIVGMDPEAVRDRARKMTIQSIMYAGRPAETRKLPKDDTSNIEEHAMPSDLLGSWGSNLRSGVNPDDYVPYTPDYL